MRPISRDHREEFTPASGRTFTLRPLLEGVRQDLALRALGQHGIEVDIDEIVDETREAVARHLTGDDQARALLVLDEREGAIQAYREALPKVPIPQNGTKPVALEQAWEAFVAAEQARTKLTTRLSRKDPALAETLEVRARQLAALHQLHARYGIVGWALPQALPREGELLAAAVFTPDGPLGEDFVTPNEVAAIADKLSELSLLSAADQGNSDSPSGSPTDLTSAPVD